MKKFKQLKKADWVGLRALFLLMASDASSAQSKEVQRIADYYIAEHGHNAVYSAFNALTKDAAARETFDEPAVEWARQMDRDIVMTQKDPDFDGVPPRYL